MLKVTLTIKADNRACLISLLEAALIQTKDDDFIMLESGNNTIEGDIIDTEAQRKKFEEQSGYKLSDNQVKFCQDAEDEGRDIDFEYSGRGMFGKTCPAVRVTEDEDEFKSKAKTQTDGMGTGVVVYAQR